MKKKTGNMSEKDFVLKAIATLRKGSYRGIHVVYSGFNEAYRQYFGKNADPVGTTTKLTKEGIIETRFARGGVMIYKSGEAPEVKTKGDAALAAIVA